MRKPELLVPASSLEVLKTAVIFGADAVYIGGEAFIYSFIFTLSVAPSPIGTMLVITCSLCFSS